MTMQMHQLAERAMELPGSAADAVAGVARTTGRVRVVLVDDHRLLRAGLKVLLNESGHFEVVGEAGDAIATYALMEEAKPDIVVLDMVLKDASGPSVAREILRRWNRVRVLMLSMHVTHEHVAQALDAGALGYASKDQGPDELTEALTRVAAGQPYLSPSVSRFVLDEYLRQRRGGTARTGPLDALSTREREVFGLVVRGMRNGEIAQALCISRRTVESHRGQILRKLGLGSVAEVFLYAARHQLVE